MQYFKYLAMCAIAVSLTSCGGDDKGGDDKLKKRVKELEEKLKAVEDKAGGKAEMEKTLGISDYAKKSELKNELKNAGYKTENELKGIFVEEQKSDEEEKSDEE